MNTLTLISGDTWKRAWILKVGAVPVNLTGASARLHVRDERTDDLVASASTTTAGLTLAAAEGRLDLRIEGADMKLDHKKTYVFDCELTEADGTITTLEQGRIKIKQDFTRD